MSEKKDARNLKLRAAGYFGTGFAAGASFTGKLTGKGVAQQAIKNDSTGKKKKDAFIKDQAMQDDAYDSFTTLFVGTVAGVIFTGLGLAGELLVAAMTKKEQIIPGIRHAAVKCGKCNHSFSGEFGHFVGDVPNTWVAAVDAEVIEYRNPQQHGHSSQLVSDAVIECPKCRTMNRFYSYWSSRKSS